MRAEANGKGYPVPMCRHGLLGRCRMTVMTTLMMAMTVDNGDALLLRERLYTNVIVDGGIRAEGLRSLARG